MLENHSNSLLEPFNIAGPGKPSFGIPHQVLPASQDGGAIRQARGSRSVGIDQSAVPILIRETIAAQSANIQGVSGATYTTGAYEQSLQAAIDKAALHA